MKNNLCCLLMLLMSIHLAAQTDVATARWMKQPVKIDGLNKEWGSLNFYDDDTRLNFAIANDSNNIYLCFETNDEMNQMKLMRAGMKIMLSTKGKSKHEVSVTYPLQNQQQQTAPIINADNNRTTSNKESFRQNFIAFHSTMLLTGFANDNGEVPIKTNNIQVAINWDSASNFIYEIAISKADFFGKDYTVKDALAPITLAVEVNGLPRSALSDAGKNSEKYHADNDVPGSEMHSNNLHHGGFNNGEAKMNQANESMSNNAGMISLSAKTSFKQKFVLNNNN